LRDPVDKTTTTKSIVQALRPVGDLSTLVEQVLKQTVGMLCQARQQSTDANQRVAGTYFHLIVPPTAVRLRQTQTAPTRRFVV